MNYFLNTLSQSRYTRANVPVRDHARPRVATQGARQQLGEHAVAVGHMYLFGLASGLVLRSYLNSMNMHHMLSTNEAISTAQEHIRSKTKAIKNSHFRVN